MTTRFKILLCCAAAWLLTFPAPGDELLIPVSKLPSVKALAALDEALWDYHVFEMDLAAIDATVRRDGALSLYLANQRFDLVLEENDLRAKGYRQVLMTEKGEVEVAAGPVVTFKGRVAGDPDSNVRATVAPDLFTGTIRTGGETIFIDPVADFVADPFAKASTADVVVYRDHALKRQRGQQCGIEAEHDKRGTLLPGLRDPFKSDVLGDVEKTQQLRTLEVATDCDGQYFQRFGNPGSFNRMTGILNDVEGFIYDSELNLGINIVFQQCWENPSTDPYTSLNLSTTLTQLQDWWNANRGSTTRDTVHQFSGKDFSGGTLGIAFVGVICNAPSFAYGISQDISGSAARRRLTAHEIGHNLSAGHDNQTPVCPGVNCNGDGPIMCSSVQSGGASAADDFSSCSFNDIDEHIGVTSSRPGTCTPGTTWCENRACGARSTSCTAAGVWGPWVGCGRLATCTTVGHGGAC